NGVSAQTGITAAAATGAGGASSVVLTSADGHDIRIANYTNTGNANATATLTGASGSAVTMTANTAANAGAVVGGTVVFNSQQGFTLGSTDGGNTVLTATSVTSALSSVSAIDISDRAGAQAALSVIDAALDQINN